MKKIINTDHLSLRLKVRKIPDGYPLQIYLAPEQKYFDTIHPIREESIINRVIKGRWLKNE